MKLDRCDYVGDVTQHTNLVFLPLRGAVLHMRELVIARVYFLHPRYFFIPCAPDFTVEENGGVMRRACCASAAESFGGTHSASRCGRVYSAQYTPTVL